MKKTTIRIIALLMCSLFAAFALCSCGGGDTKDSSGGDSASIVGTTWKDVDAGGVTTYEFSKDMTGYLDSGVVKLEFTYVDNGDSVDITYNGSTDDKPTTLKYTIDGDKLTIQDSEGKDVKYVKK